MLRSPEIVAVHYRTPTRRPQLTGGSCDTVSREGNVADSPRKGSRHSAPPSILSNSGYVDSHKSKLYISPTWHEPAHLKMRFSENKKTGRDLKGSVVIVDSEFTDLDSLSPMFICASRRLLVEGNTLTQLEAATGWIRV